MNLLKRQRAIKMDKFGFHSADKPEHPLSDCLTCVWISICKPVLNHAAWNLEHDIEGFLFPSTALFCH